MKYRDHKGSLSESMKTEKQINSIAELKEHLGSIYNPFSKAIAEINFHHIGLDQRTNWNTYYVLQRYEGQIEFTVAGMSDGILET